jgi:hypothetical protein
MLQVELKLYLRILLSFFLIGLALPISGGTDTAPQSSTNSVLFAVIGDFGLAGQREAEVANLVKSWKPDFITTVGDNNYLFGASSFFLTPVVTAQVRRRIVFFLSSEITIGIRRMLNHITTTSRFRTTNDIMNLLRVLFIFLCLTAIRTSRTESPSCLPRQPGYRNGLQYPPRDGNSSSCITHLTRLAVTDRKRPFNGRINLGARRRCWRGTIIRTSESSGMDFRTS